MKPDAVLDVVIEDGDGVTISDLDDLANKRISKGGQRENHEDRRDDYC